MKPIQEYTKQEKLEAILEYNPYRTERNAVLRYLLAVRRDNTEQIAYFESFGDSVHKIILNVRTYERGTLFGYTAKQFDEYGWIRGMLPIVERIELDILNTIHIGQSIDGTYAVTVGWSTGGAGFYGRNRRDTRRRYSTAVSPLYGLPIDTPQGVTARNRDKAEEQENNEGRHSYILIRGLFAFCCRRCCSSLAGAVCPRCSGSPMRLVASSVLPSELTATCAWEAVSGLTS